MTNEKCVETATPYRIEDIEPRIDIMDEGQEELFERAAKTGQLVTAAKELYVSDDLRITKFERILSEMMVLESHYGGHWNFTSLPEGSA